MDIKVLHNKIVKLDKLEIGQVFMYNGTLDNGFYIKTDKLDGDNACITVNLKSGSCVSFDKKCRVMHCSNSKLNINNKEV